MTPDTTPAVDTASAPASTPAASATPASGKDSVFAVGQQVKFTKYAVPPPAGLDTFKAGDILKLEKLGSDPQVESYEATRLVDGASTTVFFDEIESYTPPAEGTAAAEKPAKKTKKVAAPKVAKEPPPAPAPPAPLVLTEAVQALVSDDAAATIEAAETLSRAIDSNEFTLGGVLAKIKRDNLQTKLLDAEGKSLFAEGAAGFLEFAKARMSCGSRKADYLVGIYEKFSAIGGNEQNLAEIGWSKAALLVPVLTAENKDTLFKHAASHNKAEVEANVKSINVNAGGKTPSSRGVRHAFNFTLYNNDGETAKAILEAAQAKLSPEQRKDPKAALNHTFHMILTEWSQLAGGAAAVSQTTSTVAEKVAETVVSGQETAQATEQAAA